MRNKVASLPLFYLVAQHSFQGGTHCCKPHLTQSAFELLDFSNSANIYTCSIIRVAIIIMVVVDAILQVLLLPSAAHFIHGENRRFDFPEMRPGPRESLYISQLSVLWITFWMDLRSSHLKCRSCLQTTVAALMSQPSSQTGPKKPSLFTANTLPESSSSPCFFVQFN